MTLRELLKKHPDLSSNQGDPIFRRSVWAPFFENLHENKIIYRERFICLANLEDLEIDDRGVRGTVVPLNFFYTREGLRLPPRPWKFAGAWAHMMQGDGCLSQPYVTWTIWPEVERVRAIETLLSRNDSEGALELIYGAEE
jgi:hypothetical protein